MIMGSRTGPLTRSRDVPTRTGISSPKLPLGGVAHRPCRRIHPDPGAGIHPADSRGGPCHLVLPQLDPDGRILWPGTGLHAAEAKVVAGTVAGRPPDRLRAGLRRPGCDHLPAVQRGSLLVDVRRDEPAE